MKEPRLVVAIVAAQNFMLGFKQAGIGPVVRPLRQTVPNCVLCSLRCTLPTLASVLYRVATC